MGVVSYWFKGGWCLSSVSPYRSYADVTQSMYFVSPSNPKQAKVSHSFKGDEVQPYDWRTELRSPRRAIARAVTNIDLQSISTINTAGAVVIIDAVMTENKSQPRDGSYGIAPWVLAWLVPQGACVGWKQLHASCPDQTQKILAGHFGQRCDPLGAARGGSYPHGAWFLVHLHGEMEPTLGVWIRDPGLPCPLPCNPLRV